MRTILEIQEGTYSSEVLYQHAKSAMDTVKSNKGQITFLKEKIGELSTELEKQRHSSKMNLEEHQKQLQRLQSQYRNQLDEATNEFNAREKQYENEVAEMAKQIDALTHESSIIDRKLKKSEAKIEAEVKKAVDLQVELDYMTGEKEKWREAKEHISNSYDIIESKLKNTQDFLDKKVEEMQKLEGLKRHTDIQLEKIEFQLKDASR